MLAKMFPQDKDGKPVVDTRNIASQENGGNGDQMQGGEEVIASEVSIFEQVSAKYHQLTSSGRI
jgi:hypothetical protein